MANINAKRTERTFKDFSLALSANGGGGSVVVTELPKVGEEHIVYELQETKVLQSLVPMFNIQMREDGVLGDINDCFVFTTTKEMQDTFNSITPDEESGDIYLNYITEEDKLIGATYVKGAWKFTEARKVSDCKFSVGAIFELEDDAYEVILKEYIGEIQGGIGYHAVLFNDEPYLFEQKTTGIVLGTPTIGSMLRCNCAGELPEIPEDVPSEYVFETIPYEKIINYQLLPHNQWYFTPKGGEETVTSYWYYSNNEWVNMDEVGTTSTSLGATYSNIRDRESLGVNDAVDIYYDKEKLVINDYYMFIPEPAETPVPSVAYATVSSLPPLSNETHSFVLTICPKIFVNTETDKLTISINGNINYQSNWRETIPSEIEVTVEGISQININVEQLPL